MNSDIHISKVPDHVNPPCGQVLEDPGDLGEKLDLKKSPGPCSNSGTYLISNGSSKKIYSCGTHFDIAKKRLKKIATREKRKALFSYMEGSE